MAWFDKWFDSPYYHVLYKDRDFSEAAVFIQNLVNHLEPKNTHFLDLACGKGRHAIQLNALGYKVDGCDYSSKSISHAKQFENEKLHFYEHDMRNRLPHRYDIVLNLFTSFGYFESKQEHLKCLKNIYAALNSSGQFVFDFMNSRKTIAQLKAEEKIIKDGIQFNITKNYDGSYITKSIQFIDGNKEHEYVEKVMAFSKEEFQEMMIDCGFKIDRTFGDYHLNPFDLQKSDRLIIIASK